MFFNSHEQRKTNPTSNSEFPNKLSYTGDLFASGCRLFRMNHTPVWFLLVSFFLLLHRGSAVEEEVRNSLINFLAELNGTEAPDPSFGWSNTTDPCQGQWKGVVCDPQTNKLVRQLLLNSSSLSGVFDAASICNLQSIATTLTVIRLDKNSIRGELGADILNCGSLTRLLIGNNQFSGNLPDSLAMLGNLKRLDISYNAFAGPLPNLSRISGLQRFFAQYNHLTGQIPNFEFSNFEQFNVSYNNFSGPVPDLKGKFGVTSFLGNPGLCGPPFPNACPISPPINNSKDGQNGKDSKGLSKDQAVMLSGFALLVFVFIALFTWKVCGSKKKTEEEHDTAGKAASFGNSVGKPTSESSDRKTEASSESTAASSSIIVLTSPVVNGMKFEDLLRAPAELLGRGKHGSLYKVHFGSRMILVVKRIKDWAIPKDEFKQRMQRIYHASSHSNVLPPLAFYCSKQEKLIVYEYQRNGSLFKLLHGTQVRKSFDWSSRLTVAAKIAEALVYMHQELHDDGIAHGNIKSSNILFNSNMEACISEYGLLAEENQDFSSSINADDTSHVFKADISGFGVILLEMLTGKPAQNNGIDLAKWVHSVVREEWTAEVFDKSLISEGASEQRMVDLLQVAIKCVNPASEARPTIAQVARMINTIKEEEERSVGSSL